MTRLEVIRPFIEQTVKDYLGVEQLHVLDDGTIPIRAGSTAVSVRLVQPREDAQPLLQVFSPILRGIERTPELLEQLNEMNTGFTSARAFWTDQQVVIAMELLAESLDKQQVGYACGLVTFAADYWDDVLKKQFGGALAFTEPEAAEPSSTPVPSAESPADTKADDSRTKDPGAKDSGTQGYL